MNIKKTVAGVIIAAALVVVPTAASAAPAAKGPVKETQVVRVVQPTDGSKAQGLANAVTKNKNYTYDAAEGGYVRNLTAGQAQSFATKPGVTVTKAVTQLPTKPVKAAKR